MLGEWGPKSDGFKSVGLRGQKKYYYAFFTATATSACSRGLCSTMIKGWQVDAAKEGVPIWLESTTLESRKLYIKLGFELVGEIVVGKGDVDSDGNPCKGGEGVRAGAMIWWPRGEDGKPIRPQEKNKERNWVSDLFAVMPILFAAYVVLYSDMVLNSFEDNYCDKTLEDDARRRRH